MKIPFTKMQGLGNDFIVIDGIGRNEREAPILAGEAAGEMARRLCDRRFGIGADQILCLEAAKDPSCAFRMGIWNADGSSAEMCGNGIRAVALYHIRRQSASPEGKPQEYRIETLAGIKTVQVQGDQVRVDMGQPVFAPSGEKLQVEGREVVFHEVSMGNPHAVIFVESFSNLPIERLGPAIETHSRFPRRTNVEFVRVAGDRAIEVKVWERGAGITLACGTGACASAVAALATGRVTGPLEVRLPGGNLEIEWGGAGRSVFMTGPAVEVFQGEIDL